MIHTCSRHLVVKPGGKECTKYLVNEKTTDLHPQNLQKGQVAQSYKPHLAHLRLHFNYNISTKHPIFIDHTKLNPDKGVTTELIAITHSHVLVKVKLKEKETYLESSTDCSTPTKSLSQISLSIHRV
jgi:hypothetical protein